MKRHVVYFFSLLLAVLLIMFCTQPAHSAAGAGEIPHVTIPQASYLYRFKLEREVTTRFGVADATSRIAAQIHTESRWKADARSPADAEGLGQVMPDTGTWLSKSVCPEIGAADPWDPNWSMRAVVCYDHWLRERVAGATECDRWAFTFSAYDGGLGWVIRDRNLASSNGLDPARWFNHVERTSARASWARAENRNYVVQILRVVEPVYLAAGWTGQAVCS